MPDPGECTAPHHICEEATISEEVQQKWHLYGSTAAVLRNRIITGALPRGKRLRERELCKLFGVSRAPARGAIKALLQEGLIRAMPNRSPALTEAVPEEVKALEIVVATVEGWLASSLPRS
jgi:DNA-binding GntR family transcriptional regulator